jgi:hypothetical protein
MNERRFGFPLDAHQNVGDRLDFAHQRRENPTART